MRCRFVVLVLVVGLLCCGFVPFAFATSQEAITNGDFDAGFAGWSHTYYDGDLQYGDYSTSVDGNWCSERTFGYWGYTEDFYQVFDYVPFDNVTSFSLDYNTTGVGLLKVYVETEDSGWVCINSSFYDSGKAWVELDLKAVMSAVGWNFTGRYIGGVGVYIDCLNDDNAIGVDNVTLIYDDSFTFTPDNPDYVGGGDLFTAVFDGAFVIAFLFGPVVALYLFVPQVGKWGFIAGFTVGAVLLNRFINPAMGYQVFPDWALFIVGMVDAGAVLGSVRGGGG